MFYFRAELRRPSPQVEKRANLHFHENNLRGNLFQAIHKVCTSSSTLKMLVASSEENKDYCKMQIRSNLSEILCCSICSVGGICCNQLDQSALHWETSEFKHILKFLNPGKISQSFKTAKCCRNNILSKFKLRVILGGKCGEKDKLQVI